MLAIPLLVFLALPQDQGTLPQTVSEPTPQEVQEAEPVAVPTTVEEALATSFQEWEKRLADQPDEVLEAHLAAWNSFVEQEEERFLAQRGKRPKPGQESGTKLAADRDLLMEGASTIAGLLVERGVDVSATRKRLEEIDDAELERSSDMSVFDSHILENVSPEILKAYLRPMTREEIANAATAWMKLLRRKCLAIRNVEMAAMASEGEESTQYYARAVRLQTDREDLIERVRLVLDALEAKGGDVEADRSYVDAVVERPSISGWRAFVAMIEAWLLSADGGGALLLRIGEALGAIVVAWLLSRVLGRLAAQAMKRLHKLSGLLREFVVLSVRRVTVFLGLLAALSLLGVDMGPLMAAIGAAGLVLGLALQGTLSNFASGLLIMINRPFDVGDLIQTAGILGTVRGLTLITTRIETLDNQVIYVPNNMVWNDVITNVAANPTRRIDLVIGVSYADDLQQTREVLMDVMKSHPKVLDDPEPNVRVHALADSSVNLIVRPWVRTEDYWEVHWDIVQAAKERLDQEGITIPFPQRDVHHHYPEGADGVPTGEDGVELRPHSQESSSTSGKGPA